MSPTEESDWKVGQSANVERGPSDRAAAQSADEPSRAEKSASAAHRLLILGEMTAGIAHDFRNILAIIDSSLRLISALPSELDRLGFFVAGAREGVERGFNLTSQLLDFAKQLELPSRALDVNDLLNQLDRLLKYSADPAIRLVLDLGANIPRCDFDPTQFSAGIINLVLNARDAMPHGGTIRISTTRWTVKEKAEDSPPPGTYVCVGVADTGDGMSEEIKQKLFEPFFSTKGAGGTGLGLAQVRAFMRRSKGHISVESTPGAGTTFVLVFPSATECPPDAATTDQSDSWATSARRPASAEPSTASSALPV